MKKLICITSLLLSCLYLLSTESEINIEKQNLIITNSDNSINMEIPLVSNRDGNSTMLTQVNRYSVNNETYTLQNYVTFEYGEGLKLASERNYGNDELESEFSISSYNNYFYDELDRNYYSETWGRYDANEAGDSSTIINYYDEATTIIDSTVTLYQISSLPNSYLENHRFTYDDELRLTSELHLHGSNYDNYQIERKIDYSYSATLDSQAEYLFAQNNFSSIPQSRKEKHHDDNLNTLITFSLHIPEYMVTPDFKFEYLYNNENQLIRRNVYEVGGFYPMDWSWEFTSYYEYTYNDLGNFDSILFYDTHVNWYESIIELDTTEQFIYAEDNRLIERHLYRDDYHTFSEYIYTELVPNVNNEIDPVKLTSVNYPNPFNPETTIQFNNPKSGKVSVEVYNIKGQLVKTLANDVMSQGLHKVVWNGTNNENKNSASGIYLYRIKSGTNTSTKKLILMK